MPDENIIELLMLPQLSNWRSLLSLIAVAIVIGTIFYSNFLSHKLAAEERNKINVWVQSLKTRGATADPSTLALTNIITSQNTDIPIIETDESGNPSGSVLNLDSLEIKKDTSYLRKKVKEFGNQHEPIQIEISPQVFNKYYYGDTVLQKQVWYYPLVQLLIVALFILITLYSIAARNKSTQNQVWAGMAKETAHQLGTPISSLHGWIEMLKETEVNPMIGAEMEKDVNRLKLISDRFGKIGSTPKLEAKNLVEQIRNMMDYIKLRSTDKVSFILSSPDVIMVNISAPLFDWVIENLLKNALDSMEGKGSITISIKEEMNEVYIDVKDTGKGISKKNLANVFKPGFTTKKRGWGLGLSLSKRIVEQFHKGQLFVRSSEAGKGTTFRIILNK